MLASYATTTPSSEIRFHDGGVDRWKVEASDVGQVTDADFPEFSDRRVRRDRSDVCREKVDKRSRATQLRACQLSQWTRGAVL